jgi:hypothetical protein
MRNWPLASVRRTLPAVDPARLDLTSLSIAAPSSVLLVRAPPGRGFAAGANVDLEELIGITLGGRT